MIFVPLDLKTMIEQAKNIYDSGLSLRKWEALHIPDEDLIYKSGVDSQIKSITAIVSLLDQIIDEPKVVEHHLSKSVKLPVSAITYDNLIYFFIRDNFYDIKLSVISQYPIKIPLSLIHYEYTQEKYDEELKRCMNYCGNRISLEEYKTDAWMKKWSKDTIIRDNGRMYRAASVLSVYCEGIEKLNFDKDRLFSPYEIGRQSFTCSLNSYCKLAFIMESIIANVRNTIADERYK